MAARSKTSDNGNRPKCDWFSTWALEVAAEEAEEALEEQKEARGAARRKRRRTGT